MKERKLGKLVDLLHETDVLVVAELCRLGRCMLETMEILSVATQRKLKVFSVKGGWNLGGSMQAKIVAMVLAMAAEIERDLISQRTRSALATKKAAGVKLGRPKGPGRSKQDEYQERILVGPWREKSCYGKTLRCNPADPQPVDEKTEA